MKWTPATGKFCRSCGAEVVKAALFGAARMLKDAGVDRFGVPKMLVELDAEQLENFSQIYNRHLAALTRHVDHMRFLQRFLQRKDWSDVVENELIVELPWSEERLEAFSLPLDPAERTVSAERSRSESLALASYLSGHSPVRLTRSLATLVRLLLEDWTAYRDAKSVLANMDPHLRGEAALALTNWRVVYGPGIQDDRHYFINFLRESPFQFQAAVHLALVGSREDVLPAEAKISDDPEIAFTAAMQSGDADRLIAAERGDDAMMRYAAARRLISMGRFDGVGDVIRHAALEHQRDLLSFMTWQKTKPPAVLREVFIELLENTEDRAVRRDASACLAFQHQPGDTLRIARAARGERDIYQGLLQNASAEPAELAALCEFLLERGEFRAEQWGMSDVAKAGRLPADFVPLHWNQANDTVRVELCRMAEMQLEEYPDRKLHRFLVNVVFGDESFSVQEQAWTCLFRFYDRSEQKDVEPVRIEAASLREFFGSAAAFVPILTRFLGSGKPREIVRKSSNRQRLEKFLRYADPNVLPEWRTVPAEVIDLAQALAAVVSEREVDFMLRVESIHLLGLLAGVPEARALVEATLKGFRKTDLDLHTNETLKRIGASNAP
ncbi:MAG TPA: hypothetical protein VKU19_30075 [Bryobacteraceae bacterium]|nr:hypothetical protein [Bryobacteraceae bacterium]